MGGKFFTGWQLWQQMTFVLACGIVVTVFLGLVKLQYDRMRIRKYTKADKGKQIQTPEMLEAQPMSEEQKEDDIPFGIRAIESGIEIDGVWISRSNTPVASSRSSITDVKLPRSDNSSQLELPKNVHGSASGSRDSSRAPSSTFDRGASTERAPANGSRSSSPGREYPTQSRGRQPIAHISQYSNPNTTRNSTTLQALEGLGPESRSSRYERNNNAQNIPSNSGSSDENSDESDYMCVPEVQLYESAYINPKSRSVPVRIDPRTDLDLLQTHRLSHVAETGQLTPRVRRPGYSGEWASVADNLRLPEEIETANGVDYFVPQQKTPSPPPRPLANPQEDTSLASSSKYRQDGQNSNHVKQGIPLLETYSPHVKQLPETYQPRGPQHDYEEELVVHTEQNQAHRSQVLRKVNSGFEILRPGTFGEPPNAEEKPEIDEKRRSKRLQKRRTSSSASRHKSHFVEQV